MRVNFCLFHTVDEEKTTTTKRQNWVFRTFELIFLQNVQRRVSTSQWNPSNYTKHLTTQERLESKKNSLEAAVLFERNMNYSTKLLGKSATHTTTMYLCKENVLILVGFELYENSNHDFSVLIFFKLAPHFLLHLQLAPQLTLWRLRNFTLMVFFREITFSLL